VTTHTVLSYLAEQRDASPYEICLAFLLAISPVMIPIPGASRPASATSSARAADLVLSADELNALRAAFPKAQP
jgi:aryl-alcohol dehydrogenase-like predicted oxidoreductase